MEELVNKLVDLIEGFSREEIQTKVESLLKDDRNSIEDVEYFTLAYFTRKI